MTPYLKHIKQNSDAQTLVVQILNATANADDADLFILPQHDHSKPFPVIRILGSPVHFSSDVVEKAEQEFAYLADERRKSVFVCLGGDSSKYKFTSEDGQRLLNFLEGLAVSGAWTVRITTSRRTPPDISIQFRKMAETHGWKFYSGPQDGANPYIPWMLFSDAVIVTQDSANMLSEAAWFGLPIHIAELTGESQKFDRLAASLIQYGAAKYFNGDLQTWDYKPIREGEKIATVIISELLKRWPVRRQGQNKT